LHNRTAQGLRGRFAVALSLLPLLFAPRAPAADIPPKVLNGVDVLRREEFARLAGKRIGLVTNHTGLAADGSTTIDLLFKAKACKLVALFSPEHGIRGVEEQNVGSSTDEATGLPIHSLYGETRRPTPEMLRGLDALVYDIQDVGARFYTYITTLAYTLEAAAKAKIPVFVLDRPNPIGGVSVEGPMLDADKTSFIGYMPLPVRHGMTIGELARYFNSEKQIGAELHVVQLEGWKRGFFLDDTGQLWVNPSPNMRSLAAALFYPGLCLVEATNVSLGRGTDRPFEVIGAPWIEPRRLAAALNSARLPGVRFVPLFFTPTASVHKGARCGGVSLLLTNRAEFQPVLTGLTLVSVLRSLYPRVFEIDKVLRLLGNQAALDGLKSGEEPRSVLRAADRSVAAFRARRDKVLLYRSVGSREGGR
jgi:uncharacterized protein YbbC (DUF1343 family)